MADLTGQRLGQYLILERISKGATSTVYKAYQEKLERYVAVKVLSPHFIDEEGFLDRFKQEARAVAQLDHPNILPVYDFDQVGDIFYIVMKYVDTGTLKEVVGEPLDLRVTLEIFTQVGLALGYAHRQGVIHRDVKPGNILIGEGNWALLTDFGLAKIRAGDRKLTKSGIGMGTPDYMAPEQAQGLPVDARADLYSLGCMLHEMLTGRVPFEADSGMAVVVKHITEPPRPPREINPRLPLAVEQVILRALEKDPAKRYQTAETMVTDLARAIGRPDQFTLPTPVAEAPVLAPLPPRTSAVTSPRAIVTARWEQSRNWIKVQQPIVADRTRRAGRWVLARLRRLGWAIRAGLLGLGHALRRLAAAVAALVRRAAGRVRDWLEARDVRAAPPAKPKSTRARAAGKKSRSARQTTSTIALGARPTARAIVERARSALAAARDRVTRRRLLTAIATIVALLIVVLLLLVRPFDSVPVEAQATGTFAPGVSASPAPNETRPAATTAGGQTDTPEPADTPQPAVTPTPLPEAPAGMVAVTGGTFKMGATGGNYEADETPPHFVTVNPFYIDVVEVTVAQFARFANGSGYVSEAERKGDATTWRTFNVADRQRHPVTHVSWNDAATFCRYYGKRLPTEAEWELAAKGYSENVYSWGNSFSAERVNTRERGAGQPIPVGDLSNATPFGAYDMIGNVWEWVADWYGGGYYGESPASNPGGPGSGQERVIRGGSFKSLGDRATTTIRRKAFPDGWSDDIGFRCVRNVAAP
jgi:serine/threonine-protein kinase